MARDSPLPDDVPFSLRMRTRPAGPSLFAALVNEVSVKAFTDVKFEQRVDRRDDANVIICA